MRRLWPDWRALLGASRDLEGRLLNIGALLWDLGFQMEFEDTPSTTESVTSSNISELLKMFGDVRLKESSSLHIVKMQPLGSLLDMLVYLQTTVINQNDRKTVYKRNFIFQITILYLCYLVSSSLSSLV